MRIAPPSGAASGRSRAMALFIGVLPLVAGLVPVLAGQGTPPPAPLQILAQGVRRTIPTTLIGGHEYVALDDLAPPFQLNVREEAGSLTVTAGSRTIVLTADQPLASISGKLMSLPAPPVHSGRRWLVPLEFLNRVLGPALGTNVDLRKASRLIVVGDLRVPRVVVRHDGSATQARVTIDITPAAPATVTQESGRLLVRVDADGIDPTLPGPPATPLVEAIQRVPAQPAIAVQTGPRFASYRASTGSTDGGSRVAIDLLAQGAQLPTPPPAPSGSAPAAPPLPPEFAPPQGGLRTIAIDAGHGGADLGSRSAGGTIEKDVTLDLARRLKAALETRLGVRVVLTREDDRALGLDERAAIANNSRADLFISLHANGSARPAAHGAEIYYYRPGDETAADGVGTPGASVPALGGAPRTIDLILWNAAQSRHLQMSAQLASVIEGSLRSRIDVGAPAVRQEALRVLVGANMPAVLVETGYLTNANQEKQLTSDEYRNVLVQSLVDAVVRFRDRSGAPPPPSPATAPAPPASQAPTHPPAAAGARLWQ